MSVPWCVRPPERGSPQESLNAAPGTGHTSPPMTWPLPEPLDGPDGPDRPDGAGLAFERRAASCAAFSAA
jgi:hypothetical protein